MALGCHHAVAGWMTSTATTRATWKRSSPLLMAGRIAEEIFMHHITTGAGNDIERATELARKMVASGA